MIDTAVTPTCSVPQDRARIRQRRLRSAPFVSTRAAPAGRTSRLQPPAQPSQGSVHVSVSACPAFAFSAQKLPSNSVLLPIFRIELGAEILLAT